MADRSVFDGRTLTLYRSESSIAGTWPAISGRNGHQKPSEQNLPFQGPLTEGRYSFSTGDIQPLTTLDAAIGLVPRRGRFPGSIAAWGTERVPLVPDSAPANGRNNFFIHGGITPGSAGCIDLGPNEKAYFDVLRSTGESSHDVIVQYDPSLETAPHPLAGSSVWSGAREYITRPLPGLASPPATSAFQSGAAYSPDADLGAYAVVNKGPPRNPIDAYNNKSSPSVFDAGEPPVRFPFEALFATDRNRALDDWAASSPRSPVAPPTQDAPGGPQAQVTQAG